eukprot:Tbor_TRINITY_DN4503_c0_g1::TRINITY_DN4503_c0_g1_i1::g.15723::m.15723
MIRASRIMRFSLHDAGETIPYKKGQYRIIPRNIGQGAQKIVKRTPGDFSRTETSDRTYKRQKFYFSVPKMSNEELEVGIGEEQFTPRIHDITSNKFNKVDLKLIWNAFDVPERVTITLADILIETGESHYNSSTLDELLFWLNECRYWRCLGITKPFLANNVPRAYCWRNRKAVGCMKMSAANEEAIMELERAFKRREMGLAPNYVWDQWGPMGNIDGSRTEYFPRNKHNPYIDPDGVDVTFIDVRPFSSHEQLKERYGEFIFPDPEPYIGVFMSPTNGNITIEDIADGGVVEFYTTLKKADGVEDSAIDFADPFDLRVILYVTTNDVMREKIEKVSKWSDVLALVEESVTAINEKVDFARLLRNTRDDIVRVRRFYEEKCGFSDFMMTPDKIITAGIIACISEMKQMIEDNDWAQQMVKVKSELERAVIMGPEAAAVYRALEDTILDKKRRQWATRFSGEANEEKTLDYMLENFGKRTEKQAANSNVTGAEFDRELEPVGRSVQRRLLQTDKDKSGSGGKSPKGQGRKGPAGMRTRTVDPLRKLHSQQVFTNKGFGVH